MAVDPFGNCFMNLFFVRNSIDLDFMMPLIIESKEKIIFQYEKFPLTYSNKKLLDANNLEFIKLYKLFSFTFLNIFLKVMSKNILLRHFKNLLFLAAEDAIYNELNKNKNLLSGVNNIIFDHTNSEKAKLIINLIKNKFPGRNKFIAVPHGLGIFKNKMNEYRDVIPPKKLDLSFYDMVVCSDFWHFDTIDAPNKIIIPPLRYTREWISKNEEIYHHKKSKKNSNKEVVFIIHSKFSGNINELEFYRIINILENIKKYDIVIKIHPRATSKEISRIKKKCKSCIYSQDNIFNLVKKSDLIIFFQSSAIFDAFLQNKIVIFPSFATSNQLIPSVLSNVISYDSPDDFFNGISSIGKTIKDKKIRFNPPKYADLLKKWNFVLD